jgi:hypothetical protein
MEIKFPETGKYWHDGVGRPIPILQAKTSKSGESTQ